MQAYKIFLNAVFVIFISNFLGGCASILTDDTTHINIGTTHGKKIPVKIDGVKHIVPAMVRVKKNGENKIILTSKNSGCAKRTIVKRKIEGAFWANIISGGSFGSSTDMATDKMWTYDNPVTISCSSEEK